MLDDLARPLHGRLPLTLTMSKNDMNEKASEKDTDSIETTEVQETAPKGKAHGGPRIVLDAGEQHVRLRRRWYQVW